MRKTALAQVLELARHDERVCFIGSDLGYGVMEDFCAQFPERIFREGVSEQHVIGMAAGLALEGYVVYINTLASFLTRRCLEQIHLDLCLNKAKVRLLGSGGGLVYAPLGPTHLACDDLALMRLQPYMTVLAPCDAAQMCHLMWQTLHIDGPAYIRLAKGGDSIVSGEAPPPVLGKASLLRAAAQAQTLFITTGITAQIALDAARTLAERHIECSVLHLHTLAPLDRATILQHSTQAARIITVEEHVYTGGLGSAVAEALADAGLRTPLTRVALPDAFFSEHGSQHQIMRHYGIDAASIMRLALRN